MARCQIVAPRAQTADSEIAGKVAALQAADAGKVFREVA
jgi:hypothetical protein